MSKIVTYESNKLSLPANPRNIVSRDCYGATTFRRARFSITTLSIKTFSIIIIIIATLIITPLYRSVIILSVMYAKCYLCRVSQISPLC
jgi:hypothetical protein